MKYDFQNPDHVLDLDFLPAGHREETQHRKSQAWRLGSVAILACMISTAALFQERSRRAIEGHLAQLDPLYNQSLANNAELDRLQTELARLDARAELVTYLQHPWPRTQILSAVLGSMPAEITLEQLRVAPETDPRRRGPARPAAGRAPPDDNLAPAQRDLKSLQEECERQDLVVHLSGVTRDVAALHAYISRLGQHPLLAKAELRSVERDRGGEGRFAFRARCVVRTPHGFQTKPEAQASEIRIQR